MELLHGETLRDRVKTGALAPRKAIEIGVQIARGLAAAHAKGLVHRDLKPENVFLLADGQVKILDFGLARVVGTGSGATETVRVVTDPGTVMGTVGYMAPEQVRGQAVDPRVDLFALGAVLYEMLTGQRAFKRDTPAETMTAILNDEPPEPSTVRPAVSPALDRIVRHCLEKNANERFQIGARRRVRARVALGIGRDQVRRRDRQAAHVVEAGRGHRGRRPRRRWRTLVRPPPGFRVGSAVRD